MEKPPQNPPSLPPKPPDDDDLLASAIPIEDLQDDALALPEELEPVVPEGIDLAESSADEPAKAIRTFDSRKGKFEQDKWTRAPKATGTGATHCKTFVSKLRLDAIDYMDQQINDWLDAHPQYEVKFVSTSIGALVGKITEPAIFVSVWV